MQRIHYVVVTFVLCSVVLTEASSFQRRMQQLRDAGCNEPGQIVCTDDCTKVSVCLGDGSSDTDDFTTLPVEACSNTTKCSAANMTCVAPSESDCHTTDISFTCYATGYLPDPYNCTVYHVCFVVGQPPVLTGSCSGDWAYDPLTTDCGLTHLDRVCTEGPVPACTAVGQIGAIPENPIIYYICMSIDSEVKPILYKCEHGHSWDNSQGECLDSFLVAKTRDGEIVGDDTRQ